MSGLALRVLLVEDEQAISTSLMRVLRREGYSVRVAADGASAIALADDWQPDVILLDLMLPDGSGVDVARTIRETSAVPIIMVTALGHEDDRVRGLDVGADDYIVKPFGVAELLARIRSVVRRAPPRPWPETSRISGDIELDRSGELRVGDSTVMLSAKEAELLRLLIRHAGEVVRRDEIVRTVWGLPPREGNKTLDVHMTWLRRKLGDDPRDPRYIETIRGVGFRLITAD